MADNRYNSLQKQTSGLHEQITKLKNENARQKADLNQARIEIDELNTKLSLMADADKTVSELKA